MIAFGCPITNGRLYERYAGPRDQAGRGAGLGGVGVPERRFIFRAYNVLMEMAAKREDLEALVLLHQDAEIIDPGFCPRSARP